MQPEEEVILALPRALITDNEKIGSVLLCDDDADFALNEKAGAYYVRLKPGMTFSLSKSCDIMIVADDKRPRFFRIKKPDKKLTEPGAAPNGCPAAILDNSEVTEGPPSVS